MATPPTTARPGGRAAASDAADPAWPTGRAIGLFLLGWLLLA
jgi:hypothetical protein